MGESRRVGGRRDATKGEGGEGGVRGRCGMHGMREGHALGRCRVMFRTPTAGSGQGVESHVGGSG